MWLLPLGRKTGVSLKLGFSAGSVVQEIGWPDTDIFDEDEIENIRHIVEAEIGSELKDEDYSGPCDGVILWWLGSDGDVEDLTFALVDACAGFDSKGQILLLVPARQSGETVDPADIEDAARDAGLSRSNTIALGSWSGIRIVTTGRNNR